MRFLWKWVLWNVCKPFAVPKQSLRKLNFTLFQTIYSNIRKVLVQTGSFLFSIQMVYISSVEKYCYFNIYAVIDTSLHKSITLNISATYFHIAKHTLRVCAVCAVLDWSGWCGLVVWEWKYVTSLIAPCVEETNNPWTLFLIFNNTNLIA